MAFGTTEILQLLTSLMGLGGQQGPPTPVAPNPVALGQQATGLEGVAAAKSARKPTTSFAGNKGMVAPTSAGVGPSLSPDGGFGSGFSGGPRPSPDGSPGPPVLPSEQFPVRNPSPPETDDLTTYQKQTKDAMGDKGGGGGFAETLGMMGQGAQLTGAVQGAFAPPRAVAPRSAPQLQLPPPSVKPRDPGARGQGIREALQMLMQRR